MTRKWNIKLWLGATNMSQYSINTFMQTDKTSISCNYYSAQIIAIIMCLCVCLCVTRRYCIKTAKRRITQTTPRDSPGTLVFWSQNLLVDDPASPWNLCSKWPTPFQTVQFRPIFAHSASNVRASEQSSISDNRKSTTRFLTSHRWTVYVTPKSPHRVAQNAILLFFQ